MGTTTATDNQNNNPPTSSSDSTMSGTEKEPVAALNIGDKCQVQWRDGSQQLEAVVLERRPVGHRKRRKEAHAVDLRNLSADQMEYYVHYTHHDRRLDA